MWLDLHRTKQRRRSIIINVTSLVDVLFILLIFFAVSTTFQHLGALDIQLPKTTAAPPAKPLQMHEILLDSKGRYVLDGMHFSKKNLIKSIRKWTLREKNEPVVLKADYQVPYGDIVGLLDDLRAVGVVKVQALTKQTAKKE